MTNKLVAIYRNITTNTRFLRGVAGFLVTAFVIVNAGVFAVVALEMGGFPQFLQGKGLVPSNWPAQWLNNLAIPLGFLCVALLSAIAHIVGLGRRWNSAAPASGSGEFAVNALGAIIVSVLVVGGFATSLASIISWMSLTAEVKSSTIAALSFASVFTYLITYGLVLTLPEGARGRLVTCASVLIGAASMLAWWMNWFGPTNGRGGVMLAGGTLALSFAVLNWQLPTVRAIAANQKWLATSIGWLISMCMVPFIIQAAQVLRWGAQSVTIAEGHVFEWAALGATPFLLLALLKHWRGVPSGKQSMVLAPVAGVRNGMPALTWSQRVGTGQTIGGQKDFFELVFAGVIMAIALGAGYRYGGWEGFFTGLLIGGFIVGAGFRNHQIPEFNIPGLTSPAKKAMPTEAALRRETQPVTRVEDCAAYIEADGGEVFFCLARGKAGSGKLALVERVPWDSFSNFEEGSDKQWFRDRSAADNMTDWGVVVAQSNTGRVMKIAESVGDYARLVEILVKLQTTFIEPRDRTIKAFRAGLDNPTARGGEAATNEVPNIS
jgi:hypothetical protein